MTKGGVPQIVRQTDRFDQIFVGAQRTGDGTTDLGDFKRVRQARAVIIAFGIDENLGLIFKPSESGRVQNTVAVALKASAQIGFFFRIFAPL